MRAGLERQGGMPVAAVPFVNLKRDDAWSLARIPAVSLSRALSPPPFNLPLPSPHATVAIGVACRAPLPHQRETARQPGSACQR